jgi:hypothetical protein
MSDILAGGGGSDSKDHPLRVMTRIRTTGILCRDRRARVVDR